MSSGWSKKQEVMHQEGKREGRRINRGEVERGGEMEGGPSQSGHIPPHYTQVINSSIYNVTKDEGSLPPMKYQA